VAAARALPIAAVAPIFGGPSLLARGLVGLLLAALAWPLAARAGVRLDALLVAREVTVGLALGLVAAVPFRALEAAGLLHDRARGGIGRGRAALGDTYLLAGLALFAALGGPLLVARGFADSYGALPIGGRSTPEARGGRADSNRGVLRPWC